jgi:hypothetical protein
MRICRSAPVLLPLLLAILTSAGAELRCTFAARVSEPR